MTSQLLLLGGMTPDRRIFERLLPLLPSAVIVDWIPPQKFESICGYANRLSENIPRVQPSIVCGVSFGGIVGRELANIINAQACVLVSLVRSPRELPFKFRLFRCLSPRAAEAALYAIGTLAICWPRSCRSRSIWRAAKLRGTSGAWYRWATASVLAWSPSETLERIPSYRIHGDRDSTFPLAGTQADRIIHGGGHDLPLTHFKELAEILAEVAN